jgi:hypothetical protein
VRRERGVRRKKSTVCGRLFSKRAAPERQAALPWLRHANGEERPGLAGDAVR